MPSNVFDRTMFKAESKPLKADSGIMQGFDDEGEIPEDEMMEEVSQRKPNSPEILMNNLRGDMRSVDARYQELADMVGEDAAMETPPEVLALLQAQLAQQSMGIGALPPGQGLSPPPMAAGAPPMPTPDMMGGMPQPGAMPQGPEGQMPQGFAQGGMVGDVPGYAFGGLISRLSKPVTATPAQDPQYWTSARYRENMNEEQQREYDMANPYINAAAEKAAYEKRLSDKSAYEAQQRAAAEAAARPAPSGGFRGIFGRFGNIFQQMQQPQAAQTVEPSGIGRLIPSFSKLLGGSSTAPDPTDTTVNRRDINPAYLAEFTRRFQQNQAPQVVQQPMLLPTQQYGLTVPQAGFVPSQQYGAAPAPQVGFAQGGYVNGNFSEGVAQAGRNGDTVLAHMTPEQHQYLTELGGGATVNPETGLPEHYMGMQALGNMGTAIASRAAPYLQQANVLAGRALYNPTLSAPTLTQSRSTLGTFGPKVVEGMEMYYPTFTQGIANSRVGQMVAQGAERLAQTPTAMKAGAAIMSIPGAAYISDKLSNPNMSASNNNPPIIPGDPATGWKAPEEERVEGESTPINYNNLPVAPGAAPTSEAEKNNQLIQEVARRKTRGERLDEYMAENVPIFEKYLGGDKDYNQAQALFVLADMGLKFASSRKPGESFASAFARSAQGVPSGLSTIAAAEDQAKRQVKGAALTSGLQALAAEDKAASDLQKEIIKRGVSAGELIPTDLGGGLTTYRKKDGQPAGMRVDETITNSFLNSKFTPQATKNEKGEVTGFDTPYVRVSPPAQTVNLDKGTRERLAGEVSRQEQALSAIDEAIKEYSGAFGPKAFFSNLKNNILVPVSPLDPNVMTEQQRTKINMAMNIATKAIARTGDTGNIAVAEQQAAQSILGDKPGTFFSDSEGALKRMMTVRTSLANQRLNTASQLGWLNQDVQLDVPNLGTASDPIPQDKMTYLKTMAKTFPNGQVYVNIGGKSTPVLLSTLKD
jgi:hypothetical protein